MSRKLIRLLIAVAMALAVPVQGLAAVAAGLCMTMGHHEAGAAAVHEQATDHSHDADAAHSHQEAADDQAAGGAHCPPCVSCCATASISTAAPIQLAATKASAVIAASPSAPPGFLPDTLDRPPLAL